MPPTTFPIRPTSPAESLSLVQPASPAGPFSPVQSTSPAGPFPLVQPAFPVIPAKAGIHRPAAARAPAVDHSAQSLEEP